MSTSHDVHLFFVYFSFFMRAFLILSTIVTLVSSQSTCTLFPAQRDLRFEKLMDNVFPVWMIVAARQTVIIMIAAVLDADNQVSPFAHFIILHVPKTFVGPTSHLISLLPPKIFS